MASHLHTLSLSLEPDSFLPLSFHHSFSFSPHSFRCLSLFKKISLFTIFYSISHSPHSHFNVLKFKTSNLECCFTRERETSEIYIHSVSRFSLIFISLYIS